MSQRGDDPDPRPMQQQPQNMAAAGAQVATGFLDSMKQQPMMLAVLALNALVFAFLFYALSDVTAKRARQMEIVLNHCLPRGPVEQPAMPGLPPTDRGR